MPAIIGAFIGAYLLGWIAGLEDDQTIHLFGDMSTSLINLIIGVLIIFFSLFELIPFLKRIQFKENKLLLGGLISGFFGGVSGHQGALRSAFLIKLPLTKEQFVATGNRHCLRHRYHTHWHLCREFRLHRNSRFIHASCERNVERIYRRIFR